MAHERRLRLACQAATCRGQRPPSGGRNVGGSAPPVAACAIGAIPHCAARRHGHILSVGPRNGNQGTTEEHRRTTRNIHHDGTLTLADDWPWYENDEDE